MLEYIVGAVAVGVLVFIGLDLYIHNRFKKSITDLLKDALKFD